ncbi:hypothetical protein MAMC_00729 [Methylacidimicrobium cyclopophantes]|uniref:AB hydrolase-1 domain-containing protein n=1 Tax=Methylacidimicrobium cyclopophantes TaxID=1041766 RepID=A0A5E6M8W9_9BACT|nr:alpha/beta fold hydrolase [Methylacidimicrobium cyclopophantes]VVM05646.1 hypothetical protein MAMC_00729 [Methylacidimicrobium cyclopophantes]
MSSPARVRDPIEAPHLQPNGSERPPIVLVHGMWGRFSLWGRIPRLLRKLGWRVLPYELPEHGLRWKSEAVLAGLGIRDYLEDLLDFLEESPASPILIGHSMGGLLVLLAAQELSSRGRRARGIILITPAGARGSFLVSPSNLLFFFRPLLLQWRGLRVHHPTRWEADFALFPLVPPERRDAIYRLLGPESIRPLLEIAFWPFDPHRTTRLTAGAIDSPCYLYLGGRDRVIPPYSSRPFRKALPYMEVTLDPKAGHMVFHEVGRHAFFRWLVDRLGRIAATNDLES